MGSHQPSNSDPNVANLNVQAYLNSLQSFVDFAKKNDFVGYTVNDVCEKFDHLFKLQAEHLASKSTSCTSTRTPSPDTPQNPGTPQTATKSASKKSITWKPSKSDDDVPEVSESDATVFGTNFQ